MKQVHGMCRSVYLPVDLIEKLEEEAERLDMSVSKLIRNILKEFFGE